MSQALKILLLYGGKSGEHEVSLRSAASVFAHLNPEKYQVTAIAIDKSGQFHLHEAKDLMPYKDELPVTTTQSKVLPSLLVNGELAVEADVVFPVIHGPLYEDGCLQGLLELASVAYVGCDVLSSAVSMDKDMARRLACVDGLRSAQYRSLSWHSSEAMRQQFCQEVAKELGWPLFIKPCSLGSSVGIHKATNMDELTQAVDDALRYDETILVESFISGREIELAVLENPDPSLEPLVTIAGEILVHHRDGFYSYSAKYLESNQTDLIIPADISNEMMSQLRQAAADVFTRLKCKGMARVDFFLDDKANAIYFNELNTLPGFTSISMYPKLWEASGISYPELLDALIERARTHHRCQQHLVTDYL